MAKDRRGGLLLFGVLTLAVLSGVLYFLSNIFAPADTSGGVPAGAGTPLKGAANPSYAVVSVYTAVAANEPELVCNDVLSGAGGLRFASDFGTTSCAEAIHKEFKNVTDRNAYAGLTVPLDAVHQDSSSSATVYSCAMTVTGGGSLGTFVLSGSSNGWIVIDHRPDPANCP